jgi:hypothetical protein
MARARLVDFWCDCAGNATIEFVILFPFLMYMVLSIAETGALMARSVMLDRGVELAMRDLRLGRSQGITHEQLKVKICDGAFLLGDCLRSVQLELLPLDRADSFLTTSASCIDRTGEIEPVITFDPGARNEIMLVRACVVVDPIFPGTGLGAMLPVDASGGVRLTASSAYMNEPR